MKQSKVNENPVAIPVFTSSEALLRHLGMWDKKDEAAKLTSVAFHEAGHLVAARCLGFDLKTTAASVYCDPCISGEAFFKGETVSWDGSRAARSRLEEAAIVLLAGRAACDFRRGKLSENYELSERDEDAARTLISPMLTTNVPWHKSKWHEPLGWHWWESITELYFRLLLYRAEQLISEPRIWEAIVRVADALQKQKSLTAGEVELLIFGGLSRHRPPKIGTSGRHFDCV